MNAKKVTILLVFTVLLIFSIVSRIFFNDFQDGWNAYEKKDYKTARELWLPLAEQGDSRAQFFLGFMHDMGFGVPEDDKKAFKWYKLAREQGDSRAQLFMGYMYDFGQGTPEDDQEAFKLYLIAIEQGYKEAKQHVYDLAKKNVPEALKTLTTEAENGSFKAQYSLGAMHEYGQGVPLDYKKSVKWYHLAGEQGNRAAKAAIYGLAKKNVPEALKIIVRDAENGESKARDILAKMYEFGQGVRQDYKEAVKWYQLAGEQRKRAAKAAIYGLAKKNVPEALKILVSDAENGNAKAQGQLSMMYQFGLGVPQDNHEYVKWYRFTAERDLAEANEEMINFERQNIPQALKALSNDAENGDAEAQMKMGKIYQLGLEVPKDDIEAAKWFRLAAEQEDFKPKYNLQSIVGLMYANGQGVPQDDQEAMKWYRLGTKHRVASEKSEIYGLAKQNVPQALKILTHDAENGIAEAQLNLGLMLRFGLVVPKDEKKAAHWYRLAAEQGDITAQSTLGALYANGQGVSQDNQEAMKWYRLAADQRAAADKIVIYKLAKNSISPALKILKADAEDGIADAQYYLGMMHADGSGVPYDPVLALKWYNLSALQGHENATDQVSLLEKRMTPQQIEQAQKLVRDWKPRK